jgi:hypothetical protein
MPVEEALHAVGGGICKDAAAILFDEDLKDANCRHLDILVRRFCSMDKQHYMTSGSNKAMPRLLFKDGVTSLTKLPSAHVIGILSAVVVVNLPDDGKALLQKAFTHGDDGRAGTKYLNDMRYVFLMLLAYWSWLKKDHYWECGDRKAQKKSKWAIRKMLSELMKLWPGKLAMVGSNPRFTSSCMCQATSPVMVPHTICTPDWWRTITWTSKRRQRERR